MTQDDRRADCVVDGCSNMREVRGPICSKHRLRKAENGRYDRSWDNQTVSDRFWSKIDRTGDCWIWTKKSVFFRGYGKFYIGKRSIRAHRYSWELANGPIPEGLFVLHRCDNPPCVNPAHLFLGDHVDNMRDMIDKGRGARPSAAKTHCPQGHPYDEANTYVCRRGKRSCRTCGNARRKAARDAA